MPGVFISYIHEDEIAARALLAFLRATLPRDTQVFLAGDQLRLGDDWLEKIRRAFKSAKIVIALFSPEAIGRPWINFEAGGAWFSSGKRLIPVCIGGLRPALLPKPYSNIQGVDLEDALLVWDGGFLNELWTILKPGRARPPSKAAHGAVSVLQKDLKRWKWTRTLREECERAAREDQGTEP